MVVEVVTAVAEGAAVYAGTQALINLGKAIDQKIGEAANANGAGYSPAVGFAMSSSTPGELTSGKFFNSNSSSTNSGNTVTMPNGTVLPKLPNGKGTVPPNQRDPKRVPTEKEKKKMHDDRGQKCEGCDEKKDVKELRSHHAPGRHADGTPTTPETIRLLCVDCHKLPHGANGPEVPRVQPPPTLPTPPPGQN